MLKHSLVQVCVCAFVVFFSTPTVTATYDCGDACLMAISFDNEAGLQHKLTSSPRFYQALEH